jgi:hypothetical protein
MSTRDPTLESNENSTSVVRHLTHFNYRDFHNKLQYRVISDLAF